MTAPNALDLAVLSPHNVEVIPMIFTSRVIRIFRGSGHIIRL